MRNLPDSTRRVAMVEEKCFKNKDRYLYGFKGFDFGYSAQQNKIKVPVFVSALKNIKLRLRVN